MCIVLIVAHMDSMPDSCPKSMSYSQPTFEPTLNSTLEEKKMNANRVNTMGMD
jgi:hypothetical protein